MDGDNEDIKDIDSTAPIAMLQEMQQSGKITVDRQLQVSFNS